MKITIFLFAIFISISSMASVYKVEIKFPEGKIKQGTIVPVKLIFDLPASQNLPLNKLIGETLAGTFYVYSAKPLLTKDNWNAFESDAQIIVAKIPEAKPVAYKSGDHEVMIFWNDVEFVPTEAPQNFLYGDFEIPSRAKVLRWGIILSVLIILLLGGLKARSVFSKKNMIKKRRAEMKDFTISAREYSDVVNIWQKKSQILKEFPMLEENFRKLETVLFKYQFKATQSESEKIEVMNAYRDFVNNAQGGFDGI